MHRMASLAGAAVIALFVSGSYAAEPTQRFGGLLRARDLTPFGYLRLDMRPAHAIPETSTGWAVEAELAYQNTWALSEQTEKYLSGLPDRRELGPAEAQAIRELPGENYLVDLELAQLDVTLHYRFAPHWSAYVILSGAHYGGGFLDGIIESFHRNFGFSSFGRPAAARNDTNVIIDLKSAQLTHFELPTNGGLLDPTIGIRYSGLRLGSNWHLVLESAAKIPIGGRRTLLSTGRFDLGTQATLQRFGQRGAVYLSLAAVYYDGRHDFVPTDTQIVPTFVGGYEHLVGRRTSLILQGYISPSVYTRDETDLDELRGLKYQASVGVRHLRGNSLFTFALTENLQNINNTPDIGLQLGWSYVPRRRGD